MFYLKVYVTYASSRVLFSTASIIYSSTWTIQTMFLLRCKIELPKWNKTIGYNIQLREAKEDINQNVMIKQR